MWTIVFLNQTHDNPTPTVWVCEDSGVFDNAIVALKGMKHIKIVQAGLSHFKGK